MSATSNVTWVVIADGMHARILREEAPGGRLLPALEHELYDPAVHGYSRDLKSDHPGRAFDTGSAGFGRQHTAQPRHAMEPRHDPHQYEKHLFARHIAQLLNEAAGRDEFQRLVLVAPPKVLGDLRAELDEHSRKRVTGELAKDLIRTPAHELRSHLEIVLPT